MPKKWIREVLIDNHVLTLYEREQLTKEHLLNYIRSNNLEDGLRGKVFSTKRGSNYVWHREIADILSSYDNGFYKFSKNVFSRRFTNEINLKTGNFYHSSPYSDNTINKLIDFFNFIKDPDLIIEDRMKILKKIHNYCGRLNIQTFEQAKNKPIWFLGKILQRMISLKEGNYVSIASLGDLIFNDRSRFFQYQLSGYSNKAYTKRANHYREMGRLTLETILKFCQDYFKDEKNIEFIQELINAVALKNGIIVLTSKTHPKRIEIELTKKLSERLFSLSQQENWQHTFPNYVELTEFFAVDFGKKCWLNYKDINNVLTENELLKISKKLNETLLPIDPVGFNELFIEINNYNPREREIEIRNLFPTYDSWLEYRYKALYGDVDSVLSSDWSNIREISKILLYLEQGEHIVYKRRKNGTKYPEHYVFDAL